MDDEALVKVVAAQYVRDVGSGAIPYLREMQELAASLSDVDSAQAWRDIEEAARAVLLAMTRDSSCPTEAGLAPCTRSDRLRIRAKSRF